MSDYVLRKGEILNGGYSVEIGGFTLRNIGVYEPRWTKEYDTENSFTDFKGNQIKPLRGIRKSLRLRTGSITSDDAEALRTALLNDTIAVKCPDFECECLCEDVPSELKQANFLGTRYGIEFTLTAKELDAPGGGL